MVAPEFGRGVRVLGVVGRRIGDIRSDEGTLGATVRGAGASLAHASGVDRADLGVAHQGADAVANPSLLVERGPEEVTLAPTPI